MDGLTNPAPNVGPLHANSAGRHKAAVLGAFLAAAMPAPEAVAQFWPDPHGQMWHDNFCSSGDACLTGDFDGDSRDDVIAMSDDGAAQVALAGGLLVVGTSEAPDGTIFDETQPGFRTASLWGASICYVGYEDCVVGDFNGDGLHDVAAIGTGYGSVFVSLSQGDRFGTPTNVTTLGGPCDAVSMCNAADVNGDGIDDLLRFPRNGSGHAFVSLGTGTSFQPEALAASGFCNSDYSCMADDVNGDGKHDLVAFTRGTAGDVYVRLSSSGGTASFGAAYRWHTWFCAYNETCATGDVNGDGRADIMTFTQGSTRDVYVAVSQWPAMSFGAGMKWHDRFSWPTELTRVGDFNGDHLTDILTFAVPYQNVHVATAVNRDTHMEVEDFVVSFESPASHDAFQVYIYFDDTSIEQAGDTAFRIADIWGGECGATVSTTSLGSGRIQRNIRFNLPLWQIQSNRLLVQAVSGEGALTDFAEPSLHEIRFDEPVENWGLILLDPLDPFSTPSFEIPFPAYIDGCQHQLCKDADRDGLLDSWENIAANSNRPILLIDPDDGYWSSGTDRIFTFTRVTPVRKSDDPSTRAIFLGSAFGWSRDYGNPTFGGAHNGDVAPHISVWEEHPNGDFRYVGQMTNGHNGVLDPVSHYWEWPGGIGYLRTTPEGVIRIWAEENKHGTWPSDYECGGLGGYDCGATYQDDVRPTAYNIGEALQGFGIGRRLLDDLNHVHEFGPHELLFDVFPNEGIWSTPQHGEDNFCGGRACEDGSPGMLGPNTSSSMNWTANNSPGYVPDLNPHVAIIVCGTP